VKSLIKYKILSIVLLLIGTRAQSMEYMTEWKATVSKKLEALPPELKQALAPFIITGSPVEIADGIFYAVKSTVKVSGPLHEPNNMITILNVLPYTANAIDLVERLQKMSVDIDTLSPALHRILQNDKIKAWVTNAKAQLVDGPKLVKAVETIQPGVVNTLLANKNIDLNWRDDAGRTPLLTAISTHLIEGGGYGEGVKYKNIQLLLDAKANPDIQDNRGDTPLMLAVNSNYRGTVESLLKNGANPNIKNRDGETALNFAKNEEIKQILLKYKAQLGAKKSAQTATVFEPQDGRPAIPLSVYKKITGNESYATPYEILGIAPSASKSEIKKAWAKKQLLWHPDRSSDPDAKSAIQLINWAYEYIKDR
jgi:hypothetical protein